VILKVRVPSVVSSQPPGVDNCVHYAMQTPYGMSFVCRQQPISGTHYDPGSVSLAVSSSLWLDTSLHISPPGL
jgi:hypothetical protein